MATKLLQNGIDRIYTNYSEINESNILDVLAEVMPEFDKKSRFQKQLLQIVKGDTCITDGIRNANEKTRMNIIKQLIFLTTAIMFNKELSLVPYADNEAHKKDVEILINLLRAENEHQKNMDLNIYAQATGEAFLYTFSIDRPVNGNVKAKYFKNGVFESPDTCAVFSKYLDSYDEIALTIYRSIYHNKINNGEVDVTRLVCFDDKYKYIIDNEAGEYAIASITPHELPFNPIGYIQNDIFRQSMTEMLIGLQDTVDLTLSNFNNETLLRVNQILLITGMEIFTDVQMRRLKEDGILFTKEGTATFVTSGGATKDLIDALVVVRNMMYELVQAPTQGSGRAETGKAVETANGHTLANFNSNMREYIFFDAKRKQIDNIISILKRKGIITSDISASDIEIKFDINRLTNFTEAVDIFVKQVNVGIDPYLAATSVKAFDNPRSVADSVIANKEKERQLQQTNQNAQVNNNQEVIENA